MSNSKKTKWNGEKVALHAWRLTDLKVDHTTRF